MVPSWARVSSSGLQPESQGEQGTGRLAGDLPPGYLWLFCASLDLLSCSRASDPFTEGPVGCRGTRGWRHRGSPESLGPLDRALGRRAPVAQAPVPACCCARSHEPGKGQCGWPLSLQRLCNTTWLLVAFLLPPCGSLPCPQGHCSSALATLWVLEPRACPRLACLVSSVGWGSVRGPSRCRSVACSWGLAVGGSAFLRGLSFGPTWRPPDVPLVSSLGRRSHCPPLRLRVHAMCPLTLTGRARSRGRGDTRPDGGCRLQIAVLSCRRHRWELSCIPSPWTGSC